jgi:hypothetical protein
MTEEQKDERLWKIAQQRAEFKKSFFSYLVIVTFLWGIWWFTTGKNEGYSGYPWPIWVMLGWGIGLAFQYFKAYNGDKETLTAKEYKKLKNEQ